MEGAHCTMHIVHVFVYKDALHRWFTWLIFKSAVHGCCTIHPSIPRLWCMTSLHICCTVYKDASRGCHTWLFNKKLLYEDDSYGCCSVYKHASYGYRTWLLFQAAVHPCSPWLLHMIALHSCCTMMLHMAAVHACSYAVRLLYEFDSHGCCTYNADEYSCCTVHGGYSLILHLAAVQCTVLTYVLCTLYGVLNIASVHWCLRQLLYNLYMMPMLMYNTVM